MTLSMMTISIIILNTKKYHYKLRKNVYKGVTLYPVMQSVIMLKAVNLRVMAPNKCLT